jgi:hypothetical protein
MKIVIARSASDVAISRPHERLFSRQEQNDEAIATGDAKRTRIASSLRQSQRQAGHFRSAGKNIMIVKPAKH